MVQNCHSCLLSKSWFLVLDLHSFYIKVIIGCSIRVIACILYILYVYYIPYWYQYGSCFFFHQIIRSNVKKTTEDDKRKPFYCVRLCSDNFSAAMLKSMKRRVISLWMIFYTCNSGKVLFHAIVLKFNIYFIIFEGLANKNNLAECIWNTIHITGPCLQRTRRNTWTYTGVPYDFKN